jgi:hypothetical protein
MTSHSSLSHRSSGRRRLLSSPDLVVTPPPLRSSLRSVMIRRSWVRALATSIDPGDDVASGVVTARTSVPGDRRAA